ncbi:MAG: MMPL family transporter [Bacteroidales bacterium]|nr:MMPL family transporter [Bacteroidales bacterium]
MKKVINFVTLYLGKVPDQVLKRKWFYLLLFIAATAVFVVSLSKLRMDMTIEGWFQDDDPTKIAFNEYHAQFGSEDGMYIIYKPKDGDVFSAKSLNAIKGIRDELVNFRSNLKEGEVSPLEHIVKINTLINATVLTVEGDFLRARPLVGNKVPNSQTELDEIRKTAESQNKFPLQFFSKDMKYGGIYIETDFGAIPMDADQKSDNMVIDDMTKENVKKADKPVRFKPTDQADYIRLNDAINKILNKAEYANHLEYYSVGNTPAAEYDANMVEEMGMLYMLAIVIMIVLLWFFFRSFSAVTWSLLIVILSTIWTLGISALLGYTVTGFLILTILLILTVGIADAIHIMSGYMFFRKDGVDHITAVRTVYSNIGLALVLTAITNMAGIIALNITPVVPIQVFAIMSTLGIFLAFFFTIYLLPILIDIWPPVMRTEKVQKNRLRIIIGRIFPNFATFLQKQLDKVVPIVEKRAISIFVIFFVVLGVCIYGSFFVKVDSHMLDQYPKDCKFRKSVGIADKEMMGAFSMVVYMDLGKENALQDPQVLKSMDELQRKFEKKYNKYVVMTSSLADVVKDAYKKLNEGKEEMCIIPADEKVLSQTLFMFNNANPVDRKRMVDDNYRKANINISLHDFGSYEYNIVFQEMQKDISEMTDALKSKYPEAQVSITGIFALAMKNADYLTTNEVQSFGIALIAICIIILVVFGSLRVGAAALLPNLLPSIITFSLLGLLKIPLDFYTMMLAPIIIGISVDDTVTFITQYRQEVMIVKDIKKALRHTMKEAGQALVFTSLVLGLGFGVMSIASAAGTANMGKYGFLAVFVGLLCDLFLLPAIIIVFKLSFNAKKAK